MLLATQLSLLTLCNLLLVIAGIATVLRSRERMRRRRLMAVLLSYLAFTIAEFLHASHYSDSFTIYFYLQYPTTLCLAYSMCEYSIAMGWSSGAKRPRFFRPLVIAGAVPWFYWFFKAIEYGDRSYIDLLIILPIAIILFNLCYLYWALTSRMGLSIFSIVKACKIAAKESNISRALLTTFGTLLLCTIGVVVVTILRETFFKQASLLTIFFILNTFIIISIVLTYQVFIEERLDVGTKITGVLQIFLLAGAALYFLLFFDDRAALLPQREQMLKNQSLTFTPYGNTIYEVNLRAPEWDTEVPIRLMLKDNEPATINLPFAFPFFGETYTKLILYPDGVARPYKEGTEIHIDWKSTHTCFGPYPVIAPLCSGIPAYNVYLRMDDQKVAITWEQRNAERPILSSGLSQLILRPNGSISFSYRQFPMLSSAIWTNTLGISSGVDNVSKAAFFDSLPKAFSGKRIWFDLTMETRKDLHERLWPIIILLTLTSLLLQTAFKYYLNLTLNRPLNRLRDSLHKVNDGRLDITLQHDSKNEFGDLARSFNKMITSLAKERQRNDEQTEILEKELSERALEIVQVKDPKIVSKDAAFEQKIRKTIEQHIDNFDFQVADLAHEMALSPRQLHRRVVMLTNMTPAALVRKIRLTYAKQLLEAQAANVSEAAYKTGFRDVSYFSKLFTNQFGCPPSELIHHYSET